MDSSSNSKLPNFILSINNGMARMSLKYAKHILGSKPNLYHLVQEEGYYLPKPEARCCTTSYLFNVMNGTVFRINYKDVVPYYQEKIRMSKIDLVSTIETQYIRDIRLGFEPEKLPDRTWVLNILHTLDPKNEVFTGTRVIDKIVEVPLK
jgi:hypothetical protein